mmetsp:Transcript_70240/g.196901  ORF Transcript_70240/g.196901 Transcript_70240/m.196901 type:complete len:210 (+) Transcript_70240:785-1414(+)
MGECHAVGLHARVQDRLADDLRVRRLSAGRPCELLLLQPPGEHLHKAVRPGVIVDRALLTAPPTQQQGDILTRRVAHDVARVAAAAEDGMLLPLPWVELRPPEYVADSVNDFLVDGRSPDGLGGQLGAQALVEPAKVQAEGRQVLHRFGSHPLERRRRGRRRDRFHGEGPKAPAPMAHIDLVRGRAAAATAGHQGHRGRRPHDRPRRSV